MIALVIFHDRDCNYPFCWLLKKGFKHVLICVRSDDAWIEIDYLTGRTSVRTMAASCEDMMEYYRSYGFTVVATVQKMLDSPIRSLFRFPLLVNHCVGQVQSILGLTGLFLTPHSLFRHITNNVSQKDT